MTTAEVREVLRRLWSNSSRILGLLYGSSLVSKPGCQGQGRSARTLRKAAATLQGYQMFFLQTVAVPPNNVRPLSRMGELTIDHPQNLALTQVSRRTAQSILSQI